MSGNRRPRVLVLSRSYPNPVLPELGLWVEQPTKLLAERCDVRVVSPVPWCPPLPAIARLRAYTRFRRVPRVERRSGVIVGHPRLVVGPGATLYRFEARAYQAAVTDFVEKMHREAAFDLIHAHFIYPDGVVASRIAERWGVPFVVTEHAPWWHVWLGLGGVARQALPAARKAAALLTVSTAVRESIRTYLGDDVRMEVVPVGVDPDLFRMRDRADRSERQILFVGIPKYVKGVDVLLHAFALLASRGVQARLLIAGGSHYPDTQREEAELRALAATLNVDGQVEFLGQRRQDEVSRLMAESALVVLPSRLESFGAVLVEALACGTPVVATRCGGPEDIVQESVGELVPVGDVPALADAIARVLEEPGRYDPTVLRAYAVERFGWSVVVDRIEAVYRQVLRT